jgi:hypothetical protein
MERKIKLTEDQFKLLQSGNRIDDGTDDGQYFNWPYWIKKNGKDDDGNQLFDVYAYSEIPGIEHGYKKGGLKDKYQIRKTNGNPMNPDAWYFLLNCYKDKHAQIAAMAYADSVQEDNPILAEELRAKVRSFNPDL